MWKNHSNASPFACVRVNKFTRTKHFLLRIVLWEKKNGINLCIKFASYFGVYSNNAVLKQVPNFNVKKNLSPQHPSNKVSPRGMLLKSSMKHRYTAHTQDPSTIRKQNQETLWHPEDKTRETKVKIRHTVLISKGIIYISPAPGWASSANKRSVRCIYKWIQ